MDTKRARLLAKGIVFEEMQRANEVNTQRRQLAAQQFEQSDEHKNLQDMVAEEKKIQNQIKKLQEKQNQLVQDAKELFKLDTYWISNMNEVLTFRRSQVTNEIEEETYPSVDVVTAKILGLQGADSYDYEELKGLVK